AVDGSGNVYVAQVGGVVEILAAGGYTTVNTTVSGFHSPDGVAVDGSGNVYVADTNNNKVWEFMWGSVNFGTQAVGASSTTVQMNFTVSSGTTVGTISVMTTGA